MYLPVPFAEHDRQKLKTLIQAYPLGTLISLQDGVLCADHLPFYLLDDGDDWTLIAHCAKANPLTRHVDGQEALVVFMGEQGYISPNWYPSKQVHHRHVPTWNYQAVHVQGKVSITTDKKSLMRAVGTLTNIHEAAQAKPWKMADAPKDYLADKLAHIAVLTIQVTSVVGKFKLSQNREPSDFESVVTNLQAAGHTALAQAVAKTRDPKATA